MYNDYNAESTCDDGPSMTYLIKMPQVVSDTLAYASAASLGNGANVCGKCFALKFKGRGKYETKENYQKLAEKSLIVMSSNIGYNVAGGLFDIMIPGGGVGIFNGCAGIMSTAGKQYGGLLSDCEEQVGWEGDVYMKRKSCFHEKCNANSRGDALQGC